MNFKEWIVINEAKHNLTSLGYPDVVASILIEKFGSLANLFAKWFIEYSYTGEPPANWWLLVTGDWKQNPSLFDLTRLYETLLKNGKEAYLELIRKMELNVHADQNLNVKKEKDRLKEQIKIKFLNKHFFDYGIVKEIIEKRENPAEYKKLTIKQAQEKYDNKNMFEKRPKIKTYPNGYKWIDIGKSCITLGDKMRNCGSAGLMSWDADRTILALFDDHNNPHVIVTYSPNEKRISGDEGRATTAVKSEYHDYILDLCEFLGAEFDTGKTRSDELKLKYLLKGKASNIRKVNDDIYDTIYRFNLDDKEYFSNSRIAISKDELFKLKDLIKNNKIELRTDTKNLIKNALHYNNVDYLAKDGINYLRISY